MGLIWDEWSRIAPAGSGVHREPFGQWYARIARHVPHVPEPVARTWLYENWGESACDSLPLQVLRFRRETWSNERILGLHSRVDRRVLLGWSGEMPKRRAWHPLALFMFEHRTWPVGIVVLEGAFAGVSNLPNARPFLIEGHMRLAYHHYLATHELALDEHELFVASEGCGVGLS